MKKRTRTITIDAAMSDRNLLGAGLGNVDDWFTWRVALKSAFALGLSPTRSARSSLRSQAVAHHLRIE